MLWENLREEEFDKAIEVSGGLCIIPLGCLEKHGQHLPVGTDYFEAMSIVKQAAEREEAVVFPIGAWVGEVSCFHSFKDPGTARLRGCVGIKQEILLKILEEICDEIARNGFRKILIVNGHGGNSALLKHFLRCQTYENKPYATLVTSAFAYSEIDPRRLYGTVSARKGEFDYLTNEDMETLKRFSRTGTGGGHADIREASMVMAYDKSLVAQDRYDAECGESNHRTDYLSEIGVESANAWLANYPSSYCAYAPHGASETIGRAMTEICVERLAKILSLIKSDEDCVRSAQMLPKENPL
ncbi:MAG: creatininase family protein [Clostridia bacterium]|nr:creatininase family protein [Clostridia bacterium]